MKTAIDTNALLALPYEDDAYTDASERALRDAYQDGPLVIAPIVYTELAADGHFPDTDALDEFLADFSISVEHPSRDALFAAGEAFDTDTTRRPDGLQCPECGDVRTVECRACNATLTPRQHAAAAFLIGGHAATDAGALLTFDTGFYESYFPALSLRPTPAD